MNISLANLSLSHKLSLQTLLTCLIIALIGGVGLKLYDREMRDERVQSLRTIVELVQSRAQALDERVKAGTLTKDAALSELAESTMTMRYSGGTNYIAIYTMDGVALAAMNRKDIGKNQMDLVVNGVPIIRAFIERLRASDTAMLEYEYLRPGREGVFPKVSVATRFAPWDIFIVTGAYIDDIAAAFRSLAFTVLALLVGIVGVSVLGSLLIGRSITRRATSRARCPIRSGATRSAGWPKPWRCSVRPWSPRARWTWPRLGTPKPRSSGPRPSTP
jgi:methyl-accepting chemotaxis protein